MTPYQQMIVAVLTSSAGTGLIIEIIRMIANEIRKRRNQGITKIETDISAIRLQTGEMAKKVDALEETNRVILHDRIWEMYNRLQKKDAVSVTDMANLDYLFEEYEKYHGNHQAGLMYDELKKKPLKAEKE